MTQHAAQTKPVGEMPVVLSDERRRALLQLNLTETDLAFMGSAQRAMVLTILERTGRTPE